MKTPSGWILTSMVWLCSMFAAVAAGLFYGAAAQTGTGCECQTGISEDYDAAVLWRGTEPDLSLTDIVTMAAPILWYSHDEPLVALGEFPFPHAHPCDAPSDTSVVYYQIQRIRLRPGARKVTLPEENDPDFHRKVELFTVRYYFYYRKDMGMNPHVHDLELAEFEIALDRSDRCYEVRLIRITAFAHGTNWYNNELQVDGFIRVPPVLFVEEGKHATCPDRNADGMYTPGYDVNVRINDAWGVRDVFGAGWLIAPGFAASMMKTRVPIFRVFPPQSPRTCTPVPFYSSLHDMGDQPPSYELRPANKVRMCEDVPPHREFLAEMMDRHRFGANHEPEQYSARSFKRLAEPIKGASLGWPSVNLRWDRALGLSFALNGIPVESKYIVPRGTWIFDGDEYSIEALLSESASRFMGGYVSVGGAYERDRVRNDSGDVIKLEARRWNFVAEGGVKFRVRLQGKIRLITLGYEFAGVRFGVRTSGFDTLKNARFIAEIGAGVW